MNYALCRIDDGKTTLRVLIELINGAELASRGKLEKALAKSGIGRSAFYSSLKILDELGLIVRKRKRVYDKNLVHTELTEKGEKITETINELYAIIEQGFQE